MRRVAAAVLLFIVLGSVAFVPEAGMAGPCTPRLLVLSAMPVEMGPLLSQATVTHRVVIDDRTFYDGTLVGNHVILAMTGIGLENARATMNLALDYFGCAINGVVFSGTSGGKTSIGDVVVPAKWTLDGSTFYDADATMRTVAEGVSVSLPSQAVLGDPACATVNPDAPAVPLDHSPSITFGNETVGHSSDPFGGHPLPCIPGGGDVFGCHPCAAQEYGTGDPARFATGAAPFLSPMFFSWYAAWSSQPQGVYDADDMESAAVAKIASDNGIPFIVFRSLSDGDGDPLHLPGFPFQFFVYRQYAANNAAAVALAFLQAWSERA